MPVDQQGVVKALGPTRLKDQRNADGRRTQPKPEVVVRLRQHIGPDDVVNGVAQEAEYASPSNCKPASFQQIPHTLARHHHLASNDLHDPINSCLPRSWLFRAIVEPSLP